MHDISPHPPDKTDAAPDMPLVRGGMTFGLTIMPLLFLASAMSAGEILRGAPGQSGGGAELSVVRHTGTIEVALHLPTSAGTSFALHIHSDRNARVSRYTDVSPLQPAGWKDGRSSDREMWYPVIDMEVAATMEGIIELSGITDGTRLSWNGWVRRENQRAEPVMHIPGQSLLQWENTLWIDRSEPQITRFYVRQPFPASTTDRPVSTVVLRGIAPDWAGRLEVVAREEAGRESVRFVRRVEALAPTPAVSPRPVGNGLQTTRLRAALSGVIEHTLRSQVDDPHDPMHGGLYLFYDLDARTYRTSHWVWGWGPSVGLLLEARKRPEMAAQFMPDRLLAAAQAIGEAALRTVATGATNPARGMPLSRWDRSTKFDFGHQLAFTPCDAAFLAGWAWVPLQEATGDRKWRAASETLIAALDRLMIEFPVPPQNYWPDYGRWDEKVIDEAGFGMELFAEYHRVNGDPQVRTLGRRFIEQHLSALGRSDGLWDRTHFFDGQPNKPTSQMTRGLGWPMEGLLAAHRLLPEEGRYLELARRMADHLLAAQKPEGYWVHLFDQPVEDGGVGMKGTALWCWLFYELHRYTGEARHLEAARRALAWLLDEQSFGDDANARGGLVAVSPHSAVGIRPWFRVTSTYGAAFFGLAILDELRLQEETGHTKPTPQS